MTGHTIDIRDKPDTAGIFFTGGIVQTVFVWEPDLAIDSFVTHVCSFVLHQVFEPVGSTHQATSVLTDSILIPGF